MSAVTTDHRDLALRLLNERLPLLVEAGEETVRERVALARTAAAGERWDLEIVTYRGRTLRFQGVVSVTVEVGQRDAQGVPVTYALLLERDSGSVRLTFVA